MGAPLKISQTTPYLNQSTVKSPSTLLNSSLLCVTNVKSNPFEKIDDTVGIKQVTQKECGRINSNLWSLILPTVLRIDGFRFFFFSDEHLPVHIHVEKGDGYMRVELETFKATKRYKLSKNDEKKILTIVQAHQKELIGAWNEYFNC